MGVTVPGLSKFSAPQFSARAIARLCLGTAGLSALGLLAACGDKTPVALAPPPPPPVAMVIPPRPMPPYGAPATLPVPPLGAGGLRASLNRDISPAQTTWNLRSAFNVGALDCNSPEHAAILPAYKLFLKKHARRLTVANRTVDTEFRKKYGTGFVPQREAYMTSVYNHFALPATLPDFCNAVLAMSRDSQLVKLADLDTFAARSLPNIEVVFDDFYRRYDAWRTAAADWDAKYGATPGARKASTPGTAVVVPALGATRSMNP